MGGFLYCQTASQLYCFICAALLAQGSSSHLPGEVDIVDQTAKARQGWACDRPARQTYNLVPERTAAQAHAHMASLLDSRLTSKLQGCKFVRLACWLHFAIGQGTIRKSVWCPRRGRADC